MFEPVDALILICLSGLAHARDRIVRSLRLGVRSSRLVCEDLAKGKRQRDSQPRRFCIATAIEMELLFVPTPRNPSRGNCGYNEFALDHRQQLSLARESFPNNYEGCGVRLVAQLSRRGSPRWMVAPLLVL